MIDFYSCPKCKSNEIHTFSIRYDSPTTLSQEHFCLKCGYEWKRFYAFSQQQNLKGNKIDEDGVPELTDAQICQIDNVHEASYDAVVRILGSDYNVEWDMSWVAEVSVAIVELICKHFSTDKQDIYPSVEN